MKQVLVRRGRPVVEDVPMPLVDAGRVLVRVEYSMISSGTEAAILEQSGKNLAVRALERPDLVRQTIDAVRQQGLRRTISKVAGRLGSGTVIGYSCAGRVLAAGTGVNDMPPGTRVACAGGGLATHSEIVSVPRNLVVKVPAACSLRDAASVALGSIALHGVRRADPKIGEYVAVIGLGLLGQLTTRILAACGCRVVALDIDSDRRTRTEGFGAELVLDARDPEVAPAVLHMTGGAGVDAVIVTASSESDAIVQQAFDLCRRKGRVVIVGAVGLALERSPFYEKEIDLLISCSYGPGRYDEQYEMHGRDYPYPYVRWTENRNMTEYLRLVGEGKVGVSDLIEQEWPIEQAEAAYAALAESRPKPFSVVLRYPSVVQTVEAEATGRRERQASTPQATERDARVQVVSGRPLSVALVGAGAFAKTMHLPNLAGMPGTARLRAVVSGTGTNAAAAAKQFGADYGTTDLGEVLADREVDAIIISTRHDLHAGQVVRALQADKHVFCEKPLALTESGLDDVLDFYRATGRGAAPLLTVGFNRRFSPAVQQASEVLARRQTPLMIVYRVNAGFVPPDSWLHGREGGGRLIGEACHMLDVFQFLTGSSPVRASIDSIRSEQRHLLANDNFGATVAYEDGSVCQLFYSSLGPRNLPKEHVEIYADSRALIIEDYRSLALFGTGSALWRSRTPDKGHASALRRFFDTIAGRASGWPISLASLEATTRLSIRLSSAVSGVSG